MCFFFIFHTITFLCKVGSVYTKSQTKIKVLLSEKNSIKKNSFPLQADKELLLINPTTNKTIITKNKKITIVVQKNGIYLSLVNKKNGNKQLKKIIGNELTVEAINGNIKLANNQYEGILTFMVNKTKNIMYLINKLNLDDYLYSVLISECYQFWPLEMQKIQAVISRTYAVFHINQTVKNKKNLKKQVGI